MPLSSPPGMRHYRPFLPSCPYYSTPSSTINKTIDKIHKGLHFEPTVLDPCLYISWARGKLHLILVYVDDILISSKDENFISRIKKVICAKYDVTDMEDLDNLSKYEYYEHSTRRTTA
jgi:hypothetical protein